MWLNILKGAGIVVGFLPKLSKAFGLLGIAKDVEEACRLLGNAVKSLKAFFKKLTGELLVEGREVLRQFDLAFEKLADICKKLRLKQAETFLRDIIKSE